jgi:hypothetical protein
MENILYNLVKIDTQTFDFYLDNLDESKSQNKEIKMQIKVNAKFHNIATSSEIIYKQEERLIVRLQVECVYIIEPKSFKNLINNNIIKLPAPFVKLLFSTTTSIARGILFDKLEATPLKNEILPIPEWSDVKDVEQKIDSPIS